MYGFLKITDNFYCLYWQFPVYSPGCIKTGDRAFLHEGPVVMEVFI
jgi:hypothetical protein